jgi:hypothetical protein
MRSVTFKPIGAVAVCFLLLAPRATKADSGTPASPQPPLISQLGSTNGPGPKIQFATRLFDFGKVIGGEVLKHNFIFTNAGNALLEIKDIRTTCGCTTSETRQWQIEPGQTGTIPIEFFTVNYSGRIEKSITVVCNDRSQPEVVLEIQGTVWWPIEVDPPAAALSGILGSLSNHVAVVRIVNHEETPLVLSEPESNLQAIAAEVKTVRAGQEYELRVKLVPPLGSGNVFGQIRLKTSSKRVPLLTIQAWAVAQEAVKTIPSPLVLPAGPITNRFTETIAIRSLWTNALILSMPALNAKGVGLELKELKPGRYYQVSLVFPEGFKIAQGERVELSIESNHPLYRVIKVPVIQRSSAGSTAPAR